MQREYTKQKGTAIVAHAHAHAHTDERDDETTSHKISSFESDSTGQLTLKKKKRTPW